MLAFHNISEALGEQHRLDKAAQNGRVVTGMLSFLVLKKYSFKGKCNYLARSPGIKFFWLYRFILDMCVNSLYILAFSLDKKETAIIFTSCSFC